jgi:phosphoserine phosphatase RsbU/P
MQSQTIQSATADELPRKLLSIRVRLLIVTSSVILIFVMILITLDYRREIRHHFREKHADLMNEARTVLPAVLHLRSHGNKAIQNYIDSICVRMDAENSPEQHIAVKLGGDSYLQTSSSKSVSDARLDSMLAASGGSELQIPFQNEDLLDAVYAEGDLQVVVSEKVAQLRSAVLGDELFRLLGISLMGIIADAVVNLLLVRLIGQPLEILANQVRSVGKGDFLVRSPSFSTRELNDLTSEINLMSETLAASASLTRQVMGYRLRCSRHFFCKRAIRFASRDPT